MKRLAVVLTILVLCLQVFSGTVVYGAGEEDRIEITGVDQDPEEGIGTGDIVVVTLGCKNRGIDEITELKAKVLPGSSFSQRVEGIVDILDVLPADGGIYLAENSIVLVYSGTGSRLSLELNYKVGGDSKTETENITLSGLVGSGQGGGGSSPSPQDTSKYVPKLGTTIGNRIPTIVAGNSETMTFPVKNDSIYQARNITATLKMADETKAPFVLEDFDLRQTADYINGNETKDISFIVRILSSAPEGLYPMKLSYDFDNAYNDHFSTSETVYIRVKNDNVNPRLTVDSISVKEADPAIGTVDLEIKIKNLGNLPARDIKVALRGLKSGGYTAYNTTDVRYVNKIEGRGSATVSYRLLAPATAVAGANELSVKMDYADSVGNTYSEENQVFVPAGGEESTRPSIVFEKIESPQSALEPGKDFEISAEIKNNGGAAKNIKVTLAADQGIIAKSMNPVYLEKMDASSVKHVSFKLFAMDDVSTKNYPVSLNIEYEDSLGNRYNASQYVGVFIENSEGKTVPRIIIDNYSMDPFPVNAGADFKLKMSFLNTSKTVDVSNIKVTVTSDDGTFTPTDSGNTFYLESIPSSRNVEREMLLHVKPDAEQKSYMLSVNFEYEDNKGNPYTAKETMSVRVLQNPRLVVSDISLMPEVFVGQPVSVYLDFYNMGKSTLYNLMVKVEGDFQGQGLSYYVGNFEPGRTDFFDASFTPMNPGMQNGSILFTFEDANGKTTEIRKEFTLNVMEMQMEGPMFDENGMPIDKGMIRPGMDGMPRGGKKVGILVYIIPAAAVIIIGVIVFAILRRRHIRRKEMSLDE
jgi:hypothetical protein